MVYDVAGYLHHSPVSKLTVREQRIYDFFKNHPAGVISTVTPDGSPHGSVVYLTVNKNFTATFMTKAGTQKHLNLERCPRVAVTVFDVKDQTTGTISGEVTKVTDIRQRDAIAKAVIGSSLRTSTAGLVPLAKLDKAAYVAYLITPSKVRLASYASEHTEAYSELLTVHDTGETTSPKASAAH